MNRNAAFFRNKTSARLDALRAFHQPVRFSARLLLAVLCVAPVIGCGGSLKQSASNPSAPQQPTDSQPTPQVETCNESGHILPSGNSTQPIDLQINGVHCIVDGSGNAGGVSGSYAYRNVNIWNGGSLTFASSPVNPQIDFHAHSILVEMGGSLQAGGSTGTTYPLTIWLWGAANDGIPSITCLSDSNNHCGVSDADWNSNPNLPMKEMPTMACTPASPQLNLPNNDCFYQYDVFESGDMDGAYFGKKVLAVSAGGSLMLRGAKGIRPGPIEANPADSGTSWGRLTTTLHGGEQSFTIDRPVPTWAAGDHIVLTTTDYLPSHTEELVINSVTNGPNSATITVSTQTPIKWPHNGQTYDYSAVAAAHPNTGPAPDPNVTNLPAHNIETRAIVALLTRNIVIASEGATPTFDRSADHFPVSVGPPANYYGGHTVVRQGFSAFQVQGVEFYQLGQGGYMGHYPVHFHMDRSVPQPIPEMGFLGTFVADSSTVDSMTRFITVHATQGVTLARNVGYKSIGHGFYLEDATETNNRLYSNVAISVRGALADTALNPRMVPGILDLPADQLNSLPRVPLTPIGPPADPAMVNKQLPDQPPYVSDVTTPSAFWIMNAYNDFEYNAAVGVGVCGACYWMVPGGYSYQGIIGNSPVGDLQGGPSKYETWAGYAGLEKNGFTLSGGTATLLGAAPVMKFVGNSCSSAMNSLMTVGQTSPCNGVYLGDGNMQSNGTTLYSVPNPKSVAYQDYPVEDNLRSKAVICDSAHQADCSTTPPCSGQDGSEGTCAATVIDHYTTSFNWAQTNVAAIWLRSWWYLLDNSAITDVQNGGLTFVTGGGYSRSDAAQGFWSALKNGVLVGNTQPIVSNGVPANPYASNAGPFNPQGLSCTGSPDHCVSLADGISFQGVGFGVNQRLFSIYDGPTNQYDTIYSDVHPTTIGTLGDCKPGGNDIEGACAASLKWFNGYQVGVLQQKVGNNPPNDGGNNCVLPNAAIAWKQPNGFYYPPAFNSDNLVFNDVDIRHYVIQPYFLAGGGYVPDIPSVKNNYCTWNSAMEKGFTDIDRQTELTDIDGSLTGLTSNNTLASPPEGPTISITEDPFFKAPLETDECASGQLPPAEPTANDAGATVSTSPYEYVTTAIINQCAVGGNTCAPAPWASTCQDQTCYGVPLYRQSVTQAELSAIQDAPTDLRKRPAIRMAGQGTGQRSTLTVNHAHYYIDTSLSQTAQATPPTLPPGLPGGGIPLPVGNFNVFQAGQTYTVFFVFGKNSTKQTYSMYIGPNLTQDQARAVVVPARVVVPGQFLVTTYQGQSWATFGSYDASTGVLTVNIDLSGAADLEPQNRSAECQPTTFCSWNSQTSTCGCKSGSGCTDDKVCSLGPRDVDCPPSGCYGFSFKMPAGFTASDQGITPPTPELFQNTDPYFQPGTVTFTSAQQSVAGSCHYPTPPLQGMLRKLQ